MRRLHVTRRETLALVVLAVCAWLVSRNLLISLAFSLVFMITARASVGKPLWTGPFKEGDIVVRWHDKRRFYVMKSETGDGKVSLLDYKLHTWDSHPVGEFMRIGRIKPLGQSYEIYLPHDRGMADYAKAALAKWM